MRPDNKVSLEAAIRALTADEPEDVQFTMSARSLADRLGVASPEECAVEEIRSCADVERLLTAYRAGAVPAKRALLMEAHLGECSSCRYRFQKGSAAIAVNWATLKPAQPLLWRPRSLAWGLAASAAFLMTLLFVYKAYWQVPPGVRAEVQSVDGPAYRITGAGDQLVSAGTTLREGDLLRTGGAAHAFVKLSDGSTVEVNQRSEFGVGARGRDMTVALDSGAVIIQAAKRTSGHLYVKTPDCRVAVTGTVFSVNSGIKGSRVAVVEGTVHVFHAGIDTVMHAGDQVATTENLSPVSVEQQIAWSHDLSKYLVLLGQFDALRQRLEQIPLPDPRFTSDLLQRVPANTLLYVSIPNLGEFLSQANAIFHDQLNKSPALQQWWNRGHDQNTVQLDAMVEKFHTASQYLGDEVVIVGVNSLKSPGFAMIADIKQAGLADFLKSEFPLSNPTHGLTIVDQNGLGSSAGAGAQLGGFALVREHEVVFSNSMATLQQINTQLNAGASGFAGSEFGQQISAAYGRGAGIILAADLHQMTADALVHSGRPASAVVNNSGLADMRYLIAEHRETNGEPENHLNLQFAGVRQGVASWLGSPAPIGSLDFVTPNASFAVALLSKDPKLIADDILNMATNESTQRDLNKVEEKLQVNLRDDLAANLGGDALISLDGPILPMPSWKAVVEVHDSERLEKTLERLTESIRNQPEAKGRGASIEWKDVGGQRFYIVRDVASGAELAHYAFEDGYMIVAPNRAILMEALHAHAVGDSLARSAAFKGLLPKDVNENYSAVAYQNLSPVLTPLLSQVSGDAAVAVRQLAADSRPTAICAWGEENRIEAASNSRLFGFDFLTLGALLNGGNKHDGRNVRELHGSH
jgi:hypothetical protein